MVIAGFDSLRVPVGDGIRSAGLQRERQARRPLRTAYAERTMAADIVALARALGQDRFALAGHDRGALVVGRAARHARHRWLHDLRAAYLDACRGAVPSIQA